MCFSAGHSMAPQIFDNDSIESEIQDQDQEWESDESIYDEQESGESGTAFSDAVPYVQSVKNTFGDNGEEYLHFLALLADFCANRTTIPVVMSRIKLLFSEHEYLIEGFNNFLPEGSEITLPLTRRREINVEETIINYANKVKAAFVQEVERYDFFLQLIIGYQEGRTNLQELSEQMCDLLSQKHDLLEEFFDSMPSRRETFQQVELKINAEASQKS